MDKTQLDQALDILYRTYIGMGARLEYRSLPNDEKYALVIIALQKKFPTLPENFTVEEYIDINAFAYKLRLKFITEEDEMWFKLKWV